MSAARNVQQVERLSMPMILQVAWQKKQMPTGHSTNYVNDLYGRVTKRTLPNEAAYTYAYDALGLSPANRSTGTIENL